MEILQGIKVPFFSLQFTDLVSGLVLTPQQIVFPHIQPSGHIFS